jgi:hypothetical protein
MPSLSLIVVFYIAVLQHCLATCALSGSDWNAIKTAYLSRNFYELLRNPYCNATNHNSLQAKYGGCNTPLETVLSGLSLEPNCMAYFQANSYSGYGSAAALRAGQICHNQSFALAISNNICNPLTVGGCPTTTDQFKFSSFLSCNGGLTQNLTQAQVNDFYATGQDTKCMVRKNVCVDFKSFQWDTCPLLVNDIFPFIDVSHLYFRCDTVFPKYELRCNQTFVDVFQGYCPLPTVFEQNMVIILVFCVLGPCMLVLGVVWFVRFRRMKGHYVTEREILSNAVNQFETFDEPLPNVHPELKAVLATSKFKNVVFDKKTQKWGVLGDNHHKRYDNEKEAAQHAYLNLANNGFMTTNKTSNLGSSASPPNSSVRAFTSMEVENPVYVVTSTPLTAEEIFKLRLRQLVAFYNFWEPEKQEVEAHARNLLEKHDFDHVVRALKTKYGVCPPNWDTFNDV